MEATAQLASKQAQVTVSHKRINSIDVLRGFVMILMALDHVRDYFHITANTADPLDLATTSPQLYFTRWITHFCAPIFVFLSGTSIFLQRSRKSTKQLSEFLIKRGLWLIAVELLIISLAWTFNPAYRIMPMQVIWAIGISMVLLGLFIWLPYSLILSIGIVIVFGHNLLDIPESKPGFQPGFVWDLLHSGRFSAYTVFPGHQLLIVYPFLAWTGLMMLGYCVGKFFANSFPAIQRRKLLIVTGTILLVFFVILRFSNLYGNPVDWAVQQNIGYTLLSFLDVNKYPPSLLYLCMTIGPALLFLAFFENVQNGLTRILSLFGRVAFFYYILHLYLIHLLATIVFFMRGHSLADAHRASDTLPFYFVMAGEGFHLPIVYGVWLLVIVLLYPLCKWYDRYKSRHKEKWWLSYL